MSDFGPRRDERDYISQADLKILARFGQHGPKVTAALQQAALYPRGLANLVQLIGGNIAVDEKELCNQLDHYISKNGSEGFLRMIGANKSAEPAAMRFMAHPGAPEQPDQTPPFETPGGLTPSRCFDTAGHYAGPERRQNDRRHQNRRHDVEAIEKNKRYGRDRRLEPRRSEDEEED